MSARFRIGIDLGGTKIEGAALDRQGRCRVRRRVATPTARLRRDDSGDRRSRSAAIEQEIGKPPRSGSEFRGRLAAHRAGQECQLHLADWPAHCSAILEAALGRPTRLANDANCFALSEATDGAAAGMETVFGVILGTGCRRRHRHRRAYSRRCQCDRRRMGTQPAALADGRTSCRDRPAIAAGRAASRPFFPGPRLRQTIVAMAGTA